MNNLNFCRSSYTGSTTITIDKEPETKTHIVSKLRKDREEVKEKMSECNIKTTQVMSNSTISNSTISSSTISSSTNSPVNSICLSNTSNPTNIIIKIEKKETEINKIEIEETDSTESSTEYKIEKININANGLKEQDQILEETEEFVNADIATEEHLGAFNTLFTMASDFANINGTTIFSALTTLGTGIASAASDGYLQPVIGAVAIAVSANEAYKMYKKYVNDKGAIDPLKIIESTFESLAKKNKLAKQTIDEAIEKQRQIKGDLSSTIEKINFLNNQLANTTEEFHENINNALDIQMSIKGELESQYEAIANALNESQKACGIIRKQLKLLKEFQAYMSNEEYLSPSKEQAEIRIKEIKAKINEIIALSSEALDHQTEATHHMLSALNIRGALLNLNDQYLRVIVKLQTLEQKYKEAQELNKDIGNKLKDTENKVDHLGTKLDTANDIIEDQAILIEIGQDATEEAKQIETFGTESVNWGGMGAVLTGLGAGFVTFGPPGALVGVLAVGICGISPAVKLAHIARKSLKAYTETDLDEAFKSCKAKLQNLSKINLNTTITIDGKFGASTAKTLLSLLRPWGTGGKNLSADLNNTIISSPLASSIVSWTPFSSWVSPTPLEKISSHKGGFINCTFAGIELPEIEFIVQDNPNISTYGAISVRFQLQLSALLLSLLDEDSVPPEMILEFLKKLEKVNVKGVDDERKSMTKCVCMISEKSKAMKTLKKVCAQKIERENQKRILEESKIQEEKIECEKIGKAIIFEIKK
ncbi:MAG: hypothetical protein H0U49_03600 [Parachlamydiaceae bacterium]|nr:hypothetical protein [Parachlamydiaceae bacterium]